MTAIITGIAILFEQIEQILIEIIITIIIEKEIVV
jgi:hypothetical protein